MHRNLILIMLALLLGFSPITAQTTDNSQPTRWKEKSQALSPVKPRPKIAVVLAGGGAKGVAHVAALKAIEDAGLPIDLVVGTSIGSIVGGMYCTGYSPDTMRQIIGSTDWLKMIADNPGFNTKTLSNRRDNENYLLRFMIDPSQRMSKTGMGGVLQGTNVMRFFRSLTYPLPDSLDFNDMPIPFACVGTEAVTGKCKVFTSGNLPLSMRASMAIPTAFTPVTIDSVVYVDGGVCDNFPVDIARAMGADIVIGVDLLVKTTDEQMTNSAIDLLMHCVDLYSMDLYKKNVADADIYIPIDVTGYSAASFGPEALDTLMCRGDYWVNLKKPALDSLAASLNLSEKPERIRIGEYVFANTTHDGSSWTKTPTASLLEANDGSLSSSINLGGRIDNIEYATILLKGNIVLSKKIASLLQIKAQIGQRLDVKADYSQRSWGSQRIGFSYKFQDFDLKFKEEGIQRLNLSQHHHKLNLYLDQEWHKIRYTFGVNYNAYYYEDILADASYSNTVFNKQSLPEKETHSQTERFFSYFIQGEFNSLDRLYYPTRGQQLEMNFDLITDNLYQYKGNNPIPCLEISWMKALPVSPILTVQLHASSRLIIRDDNQKEPLAVTNIVGGHFDKMYYIQQNTFAGVRDMELLADKGYAIGGLTVQSNYYKNHFITLGGDVMTHASEFKDVLNQESITWGVEASYGLRTSAGPISFKCYWSELTRNFAVFLNAGCYF